MVALPISPLVCSVLTTFILIVTFYVDVGAGSVSVQIDYWRSERSMTRKSERKRIRKELWVKYLKENPPEGYDVISKRVNESYAETQDILKP